MSSRALHLKANYWLDLLFGDSKFCFEKNADQGKKND